MVQTTQLATLTTMRNTFELRSVPRKQLNSIFSLSMTMNVQIEKSDIISRLKDELQVEKTFHPDIISCPTIRFKVLRDYLVIQGRT